MERPNTVGTLTDGIANQHTMFLSTLAVVIEESGLLIPIEEETCLTWLPFCGARCCKCFVFDFDGPMNFVPGSKLRFKERDPSMRWYYFLHGAKVRRDMVEVTIDDFEIKGKRIIVYNPCSKLTSDNKCGIHESKPKICSALNWSNRHEERFYLTKNCLYAQENK